MTLARVGEDQSHVSQLISLREFGMKHLMSMAAGIAVAAALGLAALGIGSGVATAAPGAPGTQFVQDRWGHGPGPGPWGGPGWGPPPAPYYGYDYGAYNAAPPCLSGPLGFLQLCA